MFVLFLPVSIAAFVLAFVSIQRPERVRSWMRGQSMGVAPKQVREFGIDIAPFVFSVGGIVIGVMTFLAFLAGLLG